MQARLAAVNVVSAVVDDGRSLSALQDVFDAVDPSRDRALAMELSYGVLRWRWQLDGIAHRLLSKPLRRRDRDVMLLIWVGIYQLLHMRIPPHAAVTETVNAVRAMDKEWAAGLVNACLRRFVRERDGLLAQADQADEQALSYPRWWLARLRRDWPAQWREIAEAGNRRAPMTLRTNKLRIEREQLSARLTEAGLSHALCAYSSDGIRLDEPVDVAKIPGFVDGSCSVQDEAAQLAPGLLDLGPDQRVLDACAAPGGKACHLAECSPRSQVVAVDIDSVRMRRVDENAARLGVALRSTVGDVAKPAQWWDGQLFDRMLLDAPCSASGVVRRHPDIKSLRRDEDISALAVTQQDLLENLWPLLKPGGILLYVTCSVFREENDAVVARFLAGHPGAMEYPIDSQWGNKLAVGQQILPSEQMMDGFYFARLVKR